MRMLRQYAETTQWLCSGVIAMGVGISFLLRQTDSGESRWSYGRHATTLLARDCWLRARST
jgi:hypothetical protein